MKEKIKKVDIEKQLTINTTRKEFEEIISPHFTSKEREMLGKSPIFVFTNIFAVIAPLAASPPAKFDSGPIVAASQKDEGLVSFVLKTGVRLGLLTQPAEGLYSVSEKIISMMENGDNCFFTQEALSWYES